MAYGIDFGTTNTAVFYRKTVGTSPTLMKCGCNSTETPFPSLVALHPQKPPLFSLDVKRQRNQLIQQGYTIVSSFKSILGKNQAIHVGDKSYSARDVTALFLSYVKDQVERTTLDPLNEAVIAIPVDFSPEQRQELREAAQRVGIHLRSFVSEPSAACMYCRDQVPGATNVAVFDWGGGTLDVSILSIDRQEISELAVNGMSLGGDDIDRMLAQHLHNRIVAKAVDARRFDDLSPVDRDSILDASEKVKIILSDDDETSALLTKYAGKAIVRETITLDEFTRLIQPCLREAEELLMQTFDKARMSPGQVDALLMVGGSCEMQAIWQRLEEISEKHGFQLYRPEDVQWAVAGGAAILAERDAGYRLQQDFGVLLSDGTFYPIFQAGVRIPCESQELCFGVVEDTTNAVFVFADAKGNVFARTSVPIKGFTAEGIHLKCRIDRDMILTYEIHSDYASRLGVTGRIHQLGYRYSLL